MFYRTSLLGAAALALSTLGANAMVVDLSSVAGTSGPSLSVPELTITSDTMGVDVFVDVAPVGGTNAFCAGDPGVSCANDFTIDFATPSNDVSVGLFDASPASDATGFSDSVTISAFDAMGMLLQAVTIDTQLIWGQASPPVGQSPRAGTVLFSSASGVSSLVFDDSSDDETGGFAYFGVTATAVAPVPLPAGVWLMAAGIGALGIARRRRQKTT